MRSRVIRMLGWTVFCVIAFAAIYMMSREPFDHVRVIEGDGNYRIHQQELIPKEKVGMYLAREGKLYVFFIENELVNVYDDGGSFLYGIQFPDGHNGRSDMGFRDGMLCVDARVSGRYVFMGTELLRFEDESVYNDTYHELDSFFGDQDPHTDGAYTYIYVPEENKFIRNANGNSRDFLQFPKGNPLILPLLVLDLAVLSALAYWQERKIKPTT